MFFDRLNLTVFRVYCHVKYVIKNQMNLFGPGGPFGPEPALMLAPAGSNTILERLWSHFEDNRLRSNEDKSPSFLDNIFFAVPKQRKTVEKRLQSKFGDDRWAPHGSKMLRKRYDIVVCETCGNYREKLRLCLHCFTRVEEESKIIKEAIARQYGLDPIEKPWEIRYKDDPKDQVSDKILIEVDKERPVWFNKNLLQRANQVIPETNVTIADDRSKN